MRHPRVLAQPGVIRRPVEPEGPGHAHPGGVGIQGSVGQQTRDALADIGFLELDLVRVRGKGRPVAIFEPLGPKAELDNETLAMCKRHERALHLYRTKEWDDAEREFYLLHQSHPARQIFRVYLDRIAHCRNEPPGPDWDGVFTQSVK